MPIPSRKFMQLLGISLGSMLLARCQRIGLPEPTTVMCYAPVAITPVPGTGTPTYLAARERLRLCWLRFDELAQKTADARDNGDDTWENNPIGTEMNAKHRSALDALVGAGAITTPVGDLVQEAFSAAVYHVWRSNVPMTCYEPMMIDYAPAGAASLLRQSDALAEIADGATIAPETLAKAQTALEHDLAYYALTDAEVQALYDRLIEEYRDSGTPIPPFEAVELTLSSDVKTAAQFLLDVLMGK
jgi:hypothetical protein